MVLFSDQLKNIFISPSTSMEYEFCNQFSALSKLERISYSISLNVQQQKFVGGKKFPVDVVVVILGVYCVG